MADALDSDSSEEIHAGSSPVIRTKMISGQKRSWGDALSKVSCGQFVAKAREALCRERCRVSVLRLKIN